MELISGGSLAAVFRSQAFQLHARSNSILSTQTLEKQHAINIQAEYIYDLSHAVFSTLNRCYSILNMLFECSTLAGRALTKPDAPQPIVVCETSCATGLSRYPCNTERVRLEGIIELKRLPAGLYDLTTHLHQFYVCCSTV